MAHQYHIQLFAFLWFTLTIELIPSSYGQQLIDKETQYLSGTDAKSTKTWDFQVTAGRNSGKWSTIEVPAHWEQQGFGTYNYGRDYVTFGKNFRFADEQGLYKHVFTVPLAWADRDIHIVFDGVMTDAEVKINGQLAGPVHQGAFYRFKYNITDKLRPGEENVLEVKVSKVSDDRSVNRAERYADYWVFGGIFRPVYLEAVPVENIDWTAIDARADGSFAMNAHLNNPVEGREVRAEIMDSSGKVVGTARQQVQTSADSVVSLQASVDNPELWTAETPNLYRVKVSIWKDGDTPVYQTEDKFGFRTVEVRKGDGIYLNGVKIKFKGINRHEFWPEYGRANNPEADVLDVKLMKELNLNAVRCSHYPPDKNFLRVCDSLGIYVINELAGWQSAYSTKAGAPLVKEMVTRDANHPSILLWSNGNEGGHNKELVEHYGRYDLSNRTVIHAHHRPGNAINGIDCDHYEDYYSTQRILADSNIYMPTEFLHALHDGGGAAGLADFWELHWNGERGAGGFIWNWADEAVMRTDQGGRLDANGYNAPDGVVGPYRQKEGSAYALREIYSPVKIDLKDLPADFDGRIAVENRFHFTNLNACSFEVEFMDFRADVDADNGTETVKTAIVRSPDILPHGKGDLQLELPADWKDYDALALKARDPHGQEIYRWTWQIEDNSGLLEHFGIEHAGKRPVECLEEDSLLVLKGGEVTVKIDPQTGLLVDLDNDNSAKLSFRNGPVLVQGEGQLVELKHYAENDGYVVEASYDGDMRSLRWKMYGSGWLELQYSYALSGSYPFVGVSFDYPEYLVLGNRWLGRGPSRVWKNRLQGGFLDIHQNAYNTGAAGQEPWVYPEFKGYFSDVVWMEFSTMQGRFTVASPDKGLYVRLFDFHATYGEYALPGLPSGNISFLDGIPAAGTNVKSGVRTNYRSLGPSSELNHVDGPIQRTLYFYFGTRSERTE